MKFKIKCSVFPLVLLLCSILYPPGYISAQTDVKIGIYQNIPLSFSDDKGVAKGFFVDILEFVAGQENWNLKYYPYSFEQCLQKLENREIDLLGAIAYSSDRAKRFDFTYESVQTEWGQIYANKKYEFESILDLKFKKIAVLQGDIHYKTLRDMVNSFGFNVRFIEAFDYETVMELVANGRCKAGLVSHTYGLQHENDFDVYKSPIIFSPQKLFFAVPRGKNWQLLHAIDRHLRLMKRDNKSIYHNSLRKWFGIGAQWEFPQWLIWLMIGIGGLLAIFLVTSLILRNHVKAKTSELIDKNIELTNVINQRKNTENERLKLEKQLQRSQKMEAIGTLAGGVAHDLNNILSGLVSYPELLLMDLADDSPLYQPIVTIKKSGEKAAGIVNDLLTLARRGVAVTEVVNLNRVITEYLNSPEYKQLVLDHCGVRVDTRMEDNLLNISGSPIHLTKTVMNLVSNAIEAIPGGGQIVIATENRYIDQPVRGYDTIQEGDYVVFSVSDNGIGISPEDIERLFEPFYTKKVMGRSGTGLGMAVVWGTVKDHNGYIDVRSIEGQGAAFTLYFPVTRIELTEEKDQFSIADISGNGEGILVVDDIEEQREIASRLLTWLGYSVTTVPSGEDALLFLKKNPVDLIILDMIMEPGIDGLTTFKEALTINPGQKAVIASGFSETDRVKEAQNIGAGVYVKKPYTIQKLGIAVRDELCR